MNIGSEFSENQPKIICVYGFHQKWLKSHLKQKVIIIEDRFPIPVKENSFSHIRFYHVESPLQIETIAYEIAGLAVLWELELINESHSVHFAFFQSVLLKAHHNFSLQLSDVADYGCRGMANALQNQKKKMYSLLDLKNTFLKIPAIIIGAGPSLEENMESLHKLQDRALIFAGGTALTKVTCNVHFSGCIDPNALIQTDLHKNSIFCSPLRVRPESVLSEKMLIAPDNHFIFLNYLAEMDALFDGGWTVGNFLTAIAVHFGCDPIICIGMDYCYKESQKYAFSSSHQIQNVVQVPDRENRLVTVEKDWLFAIEWMKDLRKRYGTRKFFSVSDRMGFFPECKIEDFHFPVIQDVQNTLEHIFNLTKSISFQKTQQWEKKLCDALLKSQREEDVIDEDVFEYLFKPLWSIWKGVFEREVNFSKKEGSLEMKIHRKLFFETVIQEHIHTIRSSRRDT